MKILILGKGFLGQRMAAAWPNAVLTDARIDDAAAVLRALDEYKPDAVVNAAGKTGTPNVDWCETHQAETVRSNTIGPLVLAESCAARNLYLIHLGSGCIFYGPSPDPRGWKEDDFANPVAFYSKTKYAADLILSRLPNVAVVRLRMPIDATPSPRNLIDKLIRYPKVIDVENSVTVVEDLLSAIYQLAHKRGTGIFHAVNPGTMRHRDLIALYREYVNPNHTCEWIRDEDLVAQGLAKAARSNCILQSTRLAEFGIHLRPIEVALRDAIQKYAAVVGARQETCLPVRQARLHPPLADFDGQARDRRQDSTSMFHVSNFTSQTPRGMKGVLLAGGTGSRLAPLTAMTNKHLLPIFNKPMILYPLQTLLEAGIRDILLVTGPEYAHQFVKLLGSGASHNCHITYRIQDQADGIAQALGMAEAFVGPNNAMVILGDNVFDENFLPHVSAFQSGAMTFYKAVENPNEYGVVEMDAWGNVLSVEEKPAAPRSNFAQVGLYVYEPSVFEIVKTLKPSGRGELEITDVNNHFLKERKLIAKPIRGVWWDTGTFHGLHRATDYFARKNG